MERRPIVSLASSETSLGIPGFTFADLHDPDRLASLYDRFTEIVQTTDGPLWARWDAYRRNPDAARSPLELSNLLVSMAPHVSRFLQRLFDVGSEAKSLDEVTQKQDDLFRFKVDFVRRRVVPLLKGGSHPAVSAEDAAVVAQAISARLHEEPSLRHDDELATARVGCALMDREKSGDASAAPEIESLKRWCAARLHDPACREWVIFRFPET